MTNVADIYPSGKSLKAEDLKGRSVGAQVAGYEIVEFDKGKKIVLRFHGKEKTLVVNKTNAMIIASAYGSNPEGWVDQEMLWILGDQTRLESGLQAFNARSLYEGTCTT